MKIKFKGKILFLDVRKTGFLSKYFGLMFKSKQTDNLLFEFSKTENGAIHSFFVFFEFLAVWLDKDNNVLELKIVKPFTLFVKPMIRADKLVEIPLNYRNKRIINLLVGKKKDLNIHEHKFRESKR
ncbi:MAG: hypothetical protein AABY10_05065 [Nanoarchaeota archaeon]